MVCVAGMAMLSGSLVRRGRTTGSAGGIGSFTVAVGEAKDGMRGGAIKDQADVL